MYCAASSTGSHQESHSRYLHHQAGVTAANARCKARSDRRLLIFCAAHEVVEVDGFVFKRKRPVLPSTTDQHQPADKKPRVLGSTPDVGKKLVGSTPSVQTALASDIKTPATAAKPDMVADAAAMTTPDAKVVTAATTALLEQLPTDMSEPDRLASLCELLCAAELDELSVSSAQEQQLDAAVADAIRQALSTFVRSVQSSAAAGRFQVCAL